MSFLDYSLVAVGKVCSYKAHVGNKESFEVCKDHCKGNSDYNVFMYTVEGCSSGACQCYCASNCGPHKDQAGVNLYSFIQVTTTTNNHPPTAAAGINI